MNGSYIDPPRRGERAARRGRSVNNQPTKGGIYAGAALEYVSRGWDAPLLLPAGEKSPPPEGYTGNHGRVPDSDQIHEWIKRCPDGNIALRLPSDIVGIDVDVYRGGAGGLAELEEAYGPLPATTACSARTDGSGIRLFRVPSGTHLAGNPAPGVETVQHHHRYVVAPPSLHPQVGRNYRWFDTATGDNVAIPRAEELPGLPEAWVEGLATGGGSRDVASAATDEEVEAFFHDYASCSFPEALNGVRTWLAQRPSGLARHDTLVNAACWALREAAAGCYPALDAVEALQEWWDEAFQAVGDRTPGETEFEDAIAWAIAQVKADPEQIAEIASQAARGGTPAPAGASTNGSASSRASAKVPDDWTDAKVSEAFAQHLQGRFRYVPAWGWVSYDGKRWAVDGDEVVLEEARQWIVALGVWISNQPMRDGSVLKAVARYKSERSLNAIVRLARGQDGILASPQDFDREPHLLNTLNGVVDLRTGDLRPHHPDQLITKIAGAEYRSDAVHKDLDQMLQAVTPEVAFWLQVMFGYSANAVTVEDLVVVLDGGGANGKTTVLMAVSAALGDYATAVSPRLIINGARDEHPTIEASLYGKRLVHVEETPEGGALKAERIKALASGGKIRARYMYKDEFEFDLTHTLVIATNHRPKVNSGEHALWRRLRRVPFPNRYVDPKQAKRGDLVKDPKLRARLREPAQREAVLAWIVAGAVAWYDTGLPSCRAIEEATREWRAEEDVIQRFAQERLAFDPTSSVASGDLYRSYCLWCNQEGRRPPSNKNFKSLFEGHELYSQHGITTTRPANRVTYHGVQVNAWQWEDD